MSLGEYFGWGRTGVPIDEFPDIFPIGMREIDFVRVDVTAIYSRILTDVVERTHGLTDDQISLLWDNCIKSESSDGLITMLAKSMTDKKDLFLVYDKAIKLLRHATSQEQAKIEVDYKTQGKSAAGIYISFRHYHRADLVKLYSVLEYYTVASLHKAIALSKAVQIKINDLRASTGLSDSADVKSQAMAMAKALAKGKDILTDAKDEVITNIPDLTGIQTSIEFINEKRAFYLGMPDCYITGEQTGGLGSSGENDSKAIERGLKNYYHSVMDPVFKAMFDGKTTYKSQDFTQIQTASDLLKTFSITDDELISKENKTLIMNRVFDLPEDSEGDPPQKPDPNAQVPGGPARGAPNPKAKPFNA